MVRTLSAATAQKTTDMSTLKTHDNPQPPLADAIGSGPDLDDLVRQRDEPEWITCWECDGDGIDRANGDTCWRCHGKGECLEP